MITVLGLLLAHAKLMPALLLHGSSGRPFSSEDPGAQTHAVAVVPWEATLLCGVVTLLRCSFCGESDRALGILEGGGVILRTKAYFSGFNIVTLQPVLWPL